MYSCKIPVGSSITSAEWMYRGRRKIECDGDGDPTMPKPKKVGLLDRKRKKSRCLCVCPSQFSFLFFEACSIDCDDPPLSQSRTAKPETGVSQPPPLPPPITARPPPFLPPLSAMPTNAFPTSLLPPFATSKNCRPVPDRGTKPTPSILCAGITDPWKKYFL